MRQSENLRYYNKEEKSFDKLCPSFSCVSLLDVKSVLQRLFHEACGCWQVNAGLDEPHNPTC